MDGSWPDQIQSLPGTLRPPLPRYSLRQPSHITSELNPQAPSPRNPVTGLVYSVGLAWSVPSRYFFPSFENPPPPRAEPTSSCGPSVALSQSGESPQDQIFRVAYTKTHLSHTHTRSKHLFTLKKADGFFVVIPARTTGEQLVDAKEKRDKMDG